MLYQLASFLLFTIAVLATAHRLALLPPRVLRAIAARSSRNKSLRNISSNPPPRSTPKSPSSSSQSHPQTQIDPEIGPPADPNIPNGASSGLSLLNASSVLLRKTPASFPLIHKSHLSESTAIYRFALPRPTDSLGLAPGQCITVLAPLHGKILRRNYTPVTLDSDFYANTKSTASSKTTTQHNTTTNYTNTRGYFELLVKSYPSGNVSKHIASLPLGACIQVLGPSSSAGSFVYSPHMARHINMIAAGTGIIPIYQLLLYILSSPDLSSSHHAHHYPHHLNPNHAHPSISLIYINDSERDVLLKRQLDSLPIDITYIYTSSLPDSQSSDSPIILSRDIFTKHTLLPDKNNNQSVRLLLSGPPPMVSAMRKVAVDAGYAPARKGPSRPDDQVFVF